MVDKVTDVEDDTELEETTVVMTLVELASIVVKDGEGEKEDDIVKKDEEDVSSTVMEEDIEDETGGEVKIEDDTELSMAVDIIINETAASDEEEMTVVIITDGVKMEVGEEEEEGKERVIIRSSSIDEVGGEGSADMNMSSLLLDMTELSFCALAIVGSNRNPIRRRELANIISKI